MDGKNQHGSPPPNSSSRSLRPSLKNLYEIGPLRLSPPSLKTAHAFISRKNLLHNAALLKSHCSPSTKLCAMVKADAYGHRARLVVSALNAGPADCFAVATIEEAADIFPFAAGLPILITIPLFDDLDPELIKLAQARSFHTTLCSSTALHYLRSYLDPDLPPLNLHLKIDTGMHRLGADPTEAQLILHTLQKNNLLQLAGVFTHFATADEPDLTYTNRQLQDFQNFLTTAGLDRDPSVIKHTANTVATLRLPAAHFDMVRCGIGLYGYPGFSPEIVPPASCRPITDPQSLTPIPQLLTPNPQSLTPNYGLRPILKFQAPVVQIKTLPQGASCGYGQTFTAPRDTRLGIVTVGYADGLFRRLSNRAVMRYANHHLPIIGRISMDLTAIDLTDLPSPHEGMTVTILDDDPTSPCSAANLARLAHTIPYEILTALGNRIKRTLTD